MKNRVIDLLLVYLFLGSCLTMHAQDKDFHIYLAFGQSNKAMHVWNRRIV